MFEQKLNILKKSLGWHYTSNDELLFSCPKCKHHKKKLSVNIEKNVFKCWICDFRGTDLIKLVASSMKSEWRQLTSHVDITRFEDIFSESPEVLVEHESLELPEYFSSLSQKNLSSVGVRAKNYLLERGITEQEILLYKMGFCFHGKYKNRIIVPSFDDDGRLNFFIARSFVDSNIKYMNPPCSKDVIFNDIFIDWSKPIVLVEGFFDSIKLKNSVPVLGSTLSLRSKLFAKIAENQNKVYICLDKDAKEKEFKIIKNLLDFGIEIGKIELDGYYDLGEVPAATAGTLKKGATIIRQEDYLLYKLNIGGQ